MNGKLALASLVLAFACACASIAPQPPDSSVARVADGVYTVRLATRVSGDETLEPARVSFIVGPRGVAVIDTGLTYRDGMAVLRAIERTTRAPVRLAILTHPAQEAIFGAAAFQERGAAIAMHADAATLMAARCDACLERLRAALGASAMQGTRVVVPDRVVRDGEVLDDIGRPLRIVAPGWTSAPGAIGVLDAATSTLAAGSLVSIASVPDLRDADLERWRAALERLAQLRCAHLVPAHGRVGACTDIARHARYLEDLETRVRELFARGTELGDIGAPSELPQYASWDRYAALHRANASRVYLRLEREALVEPSPH
jgi:glyoxylase-like metal-dependent hydrolase (beta-lactamase superfamily II)